MPRLPQNLRARYAICCWWDHEGQIVDADNQANWLLGTLPQSRFRILNRGLLILPDFVLSKPSGEQVYRFHRKRRLPMAEFTMFKNGQPHCSIHQRSPLLNRYRLDFVNGQTWAFHMPLFKVHFVARSRNDDEAGICVKSNRLWYAFFPGAEDDSDLLAALAFFQSERLRF